MGTLSVCDPQVELAMTSPYSIELYPVTNTTVVVTRPRTVAGVNARVAVPNVRICAKAKIVRNDLTRCSGRKAAFATFFYVWGWASKLLQKIYDDDYTFKVVR